MIDRHLIRFQSTLCKVDTVFQPQLVMKLFHQQRISLGVTGSKRWRHMVLLRRPSRRQLFAGKMRMVKVLYILSLIRSIRVEKLLKRTCPYLKFLLKNLADKWWLRFLVLHMLSVVGTDGVFRDCGWGGTLHCGNWGLVRFLRKTKVPSRGLKRLRRWRVVNFVLASGLGHRWDILNIKCTAIVRIVSCLTHGI